MHCYFIQATLIDGMMLAALLLLSLVVLETVLASLKQDVFTVGQTDLNNNNNNNMYFSYAYRTKFSAAY